MRVGDEGKVERLRSTEGVLLVREWREVLLLRVRVENGGEPDWDEMAREQERAFVEEKAILVLDLLGIGGGLIGMWGFG
jgi:hypothetical protein